MKLLFVVEGFTDIRFVKGLSEICALTLLVSEGPFRSSGLGERIRELGLPVETVILPGGRLEFQWRSFGWLWRQARKYDLIFSQEMLRGSFNAVMVGRARRVPVVTYLTTPAVEYFRCRRQRRQIGWAQSVMGESVIRLLMGISGRLANHCLALGEYLESIAKTYSPHCSRFLYYGVDTAAYHPLPPADRKALRERLSLPTDKFLVLFSSRVSHEKDPETALKAAELARSGGLDLVLLNLSGQHQQFLQLADKLEIKEREKWIRALPAVHPMRELPAYYQAADVLLQTSLAEGCGISPLEALACGTPVVATAIGGLLQLEGFSQLVPPADPAQTGDALRWVAANPDEARRQALEGCRFVQREWNRQKAFSALSACFERYS